MVCSKLQHKDKPSKGIKIMWSDTYFLDIDLGNMLLNNLCLL